MADGFNDLSARLATVLPLDTKGPLYNSVIPTLMHCIYSISETLRKSQRVSLVGTANAFGDDQLNVDVLAEQIIRTEIAKCPSIHTASSEEDPVERSVEEGSGRTSKPENGGKEQYTIAFDPLDGSSIIAPNWTVGTIIGIWEGVTALHQPPHEKQIASVLGVYGPRTTIIVATRLPGSTPTCFEVGLSGKHVDAERCEIIRPRIQLLKPPFKTRYFAPANLRAAAEDERYLQLINQYIQEKCTLRYSGGLVPDVVHTLVKGQGLYVSPVTTASKAKLRRLYELAPIALIIECSGGVAIDPADGKRILERAIGDCDERAGLLCGTTEEVESVRAAFGI